MVEYFYSVVVGGIKVDYVGSQVIKVSSKFKNHEHALSLLTEHVAKKRKCDVENVVIMSYQLLEGEEE